MSKEKLLKHKQKTKSSKPKFIRQDIHKKKRLAKVWRKPRGCDSKKRLRMQNRVIVSPGYGSPVEVRGLTINGFEIIHVSSITDVSKLNPDKHVVIISGKLGFKKKKHIIQVLIKNKIEILNIKNPQDYVKKREDLMKVKKDKKSEKDKKESEKKKEVKEDKKSIEDTVTEEDKKKVEKQEIDKLLTKRT